MEPPTYPDSVVEVQTAFKDLELVCVEECEKHLTRVIDDELWRSIRKKDGREFASLPHWIVHPQPEGLGARSQRSGEFLRSLLLSAGRVAAWVTILDHIRMKRGAPKKVVEDEDCRPFYQVSKASNAIDRKLIRLRSIAPALFQEVAEGTLSLHAALLKAGISKKKVGFVGRRRLAC